MDMAGAIRKTQVLKAIPSTSKRIIAKWLAETVVALKRSANRQQRSGPGRHTGQMARNIGMEIEGTDISHKALVGTGVGGTQSVKYASIQDQGGTIRKKDKKLTIPLPGVKGRIANYPGGFFIKSKRGNVLYVIPKWGKVRGGENSKRKGFTPLFVLKDEVTIPASGWFTLPMSGRELLLSALMNPEAVYKAAESGAGT